VTTASNLSDNQDLRDSERQHKTHQCWANGPWNSCHKGDAKPLPDDPHRWSSNLFTKSKQTW
jgi:hypothetical protein